jgi:AcrR family transcriptional regulator
MSQLAVERGERRAKAKSATRAAILEAARRVAARDGARDLSLRGVAAEAGFAPAALYGYFRNKDELVVALAAEDLGAVSRAMRDAGRDAVGSGRLSAVTTAALSWLRGAETLAAATTALPAIAGASNAERLFNGRLIAVLTALAEATGQKPDSRAAQADVVVLAAALSGLALMARSGRLDALGFGADELLVCLGTRFGAAI